MHGRRQNRPDRRQKRFDSKNYGSCANWHGVPKAWGPGGNVRGRTKVSVGGGRAPKMLTSPVGGNGRFSRGFLLRCSTVPRSGERRILPGRARSLETVGSRPVSRANEFLAHSAADSANTDRRYDHEHRCRRLGDGGVGGDGRRGGAQLPLPGEEVGAVEVAVVVGVACCGRLQAEVALPCGEVGGVDVAVAVEVAGRSRQERDFAGGVELREVPRIGAGDGERAGGR